MTFTDVNEHSSKLFDDLSVNNNFNNKDQHQKLTRLNTSIWNIFPGHQQTKNFERKNTNQQVQEENSFLHPPSDLSRSISNKSITFASVFNELENPTTLNLDKPIENEDLVIVVPNKYVNNEPTISNSNPEPYPFRSELPASILSKSHSSMNTINSSRSKKKYLHHLIRFHRPKKLRHPVKPIDRSISTPALLLSSSPTSTTNEHHQSLKTIRQWFKSSSFGRFIQSFAKYPNNSTKSRVKSPTSRKYSDLIY